MLRLSVGFALAIGTVSAASIFTTGFEPAAYSPGSLNGQDTWIGGGLPTVQTSFVNGGTQAVSASGTIQSFVNRPIIYNSIGNPDQVVDVQVDFFLDANASGQIFTIVGYSSSLGFMGQIAVFSSGAMRIGNTGGFTGNQNLTKGVWHTVRSSLNFATQTASGYLDNVFFASIGLDPSLAPTDLTFVGLGINNAGAPVTGGAYWDNLSVASTGGAAVPEPGSAVLLALGVAGLLLCRTRSTSR